MFAIYFQIFESLKNVKLYEKIYTAFSMNSCYVRNPVNFHRTSLRERKTMRVRTELRPDISE